MKSFSLSVGGPTPTAIFVALLLFGLAGACSGSTNRAFDGAKGGTDSVSGSSTGGKGAMTQAGTAPAQTGGAQAGAENGAMGGEGGNEPAPECFSGQQTACWELEDGTPIDGPMLDMGSCHVGQRFCDEAGQWGPCLGATGPRSKDACDVAGNDDDCDGMPNSGCKCVDGAKRSCGTDEGSCVKGQQTCAGDVWGPCQGEVTPQALDSCLTDGNDDNCNGKPNEGCPCIGEETGVCGDCGSKQCNATGRQWSACQAAPSECASTTKVRDCSAEGTWVTSSCQFACLDGQCTGSCSPDDTRCVTGPERRQKCSDQGIWTTVQTCSGIEQCKNDGADCIAPCAGQKLCPGNVCAPSGGCCSDAECSGGFACVNGTCSTTTCQAGLKGPCGGVCTSGCCSASDCGDRANMSRSCNNSHQCIYQCKGNWGNCDGNDGNGCEVSLVTGTKTGTTVSNCGECGNTCDFVNPEGGTDCHTFGNSCAYAECIATFTQIGDPTDEYAYDCQVHRPHATLRRGDCSIGCTYDCEPGQKDCNYSASDGCETPTAQADESCYGDPFWGGSFD